MVLELRDSAASVYCTVGIQRPWREVFWCWSEVTPVLWVRCDIQSPVSLNQRPGRTAGSGKRRLDGWTRSIPKETERACRTSTARPAEQVFAVFVLSDWRIVQYDM